MENVVEKLLDRTDRLDEVMLLLAESQITPTKRIDTLTEPLDRVAQESAERDQRVGERIESLVSAIGEFVRNKPITG
jgi:hypothetical protein